MIGGEGGASEDGDGSDIEGGRGWMRISEAGREKRQQGRSQKRPGGETARVLDNLDPGDSEKAQEQSIGCF